MTDGRQLLAEYVATGSETAFRELVARYVDLVYSTALRLVNGNTHQAEDVAQTVFIDLAKAARTFAPEVMLGGWLHRHTCFVAANAMRGERRRLAREQEAVTMKALHESSGADFAHVAPALDEAINELGDADRTAILLRFFEESDFRSVGEALGSSEDAARMRVTRALEKLQEALRRRGVGTTAAALPLVLAANAVQAAPVGLTGTISTAMTLAGTTTLAATAATKAITMTTLQKTLIIATVTIGVGIGAYEAGQSSGSMRTTGKTYPSEPTEEGARQHEEDVRRMEAGREENERLKHDAEEAIRLRGEVGRLRNAVAELGATNQLLGDKVEALTDQMASNSLPAKTFMAFGQAEARWGQAIATSGWKTPDGKRLMVVAIPQQIAGAPQQINLKAKVLELTEDANERLGLAQFNADEEGSVRAVTLTPEQTEAVAEAVRTKAEGITSRNAPGLIANSGTQARLQVERDDSAENLTIDLIPTISADGQSVRVVLGTRINLPATANH